MSLISKIKGKKKITIGIVCLLILSIVAGFGYYQVQKGKKRDTKAVTKETEQDTEDMDKKKAHVTYEGVAVPEIHFKSKE